MGTRTHRSAGTAGDAALWGGSSAVVGMAANPRGAHQVGRGFADRVTTHVVAIFAGVPGVGADRHACLVYRSFSPKRVLAYLLDRLAFGLMQARFPED